MNRKQVDLDLGTPALSPTVQRAGQYNVAVTPTPKTNSALQLAQALRVAPQILGQASNIAKGLGAEAALKVDNVEEAMLDDDAKGILGYNKAYQHGLVKRHFAMNKEAIRERFKNVAGRTNLPTGNTDADRMASINEFVANLDKERDAFNQELQEMFGGDAHREEALQVLSATFVDGLYNEAMGDYKENLIQQTEMLISGDASTLLQTREDSEGNEIPMSQRVSAALDYQRNQLKALGVSGKLIGDKMRESISASIAVDISQGRYREAVEKLAQAEAYKVTGNATLFGTAEGQKMKVSLRASIERARGAAEESFSDNSKGVERYVDAFMQEISIQASPEDRMNTAMRLAKRAGVPDEEAEAFAKEVSTGDFDDFVVAYARLAQNVTNETTRDILNDQADNIREAKTKHFGGSASTIGTFSAEDMGQLEASIREVLDLNPNTSRTNLPMSVNGRKVNFQDPDYIEMMSRVNRDYEWATVPTQRGSIIREAQKDIRAKNRSGRLIYGEYADEYAVAISSDLNEEAPSLWRQAKGDIAVYEGLLQDRADELKTEYKRRADLRGNTEGLLDINLSVEKEAEAVDAAKKSKTIRDLKSFQGTGTVKDLISDRKLLKGLKTGGRNLSRSDKKRLIQASLIHRGFPTMESIDLELLSDALMGFQDVRLGVAVEDNYILAMKAYERGDDATPEQKAARERWSELGFDSLEDFITLDEAQETLRNLNNR